METPIKMLPTDTASKMVKIILVTPKCKINMWLSNNLFFQYCNSNIGLFCIAPCKVIAFDSLWLIFGMSSF